MKPIKVVLMTRADGPAHYQAIYNKPMLDTLRNPMDPNTICYKVVAVIDPRENRPVQPSKPQILVVAVWPFLLVVIHTVAEFLGLQRKYVDCEYCYLVLAPEEDIRKIWRLLEE